MPDALPQLTPLLNLGAAGAVLVWLMWSVSRRLESMEKLIGREGRLNREAIDRLSRTILLDILDRSTSRRVKEQAAAISQQIDESMARAAVEIEKGAAA